MKFDWLFKVSLVNDIVNVSDCILLLTAKTLWHYTLQMQLKLNIKSTKYCYITKVNEAWINFKMETMHVLVVYIVFTANK